MPTSTKCNFITDHNHRQADHRSYHHARHGLLLREEKHCSGDGRGSVTAKRRQVRGPGAVDMPERQELLLNVQGGDVLDAYEQGVTGRGEVVIWWACDIVYVGYFW